MSQRLTANELRKLADICSHLKRRFPDKSIYYLGGDSIILEFSVEAVGIFETYRRELDTEFPEVSQRIPTSDGFDLIPCNLW